MLKHHCDVCEKLTEVQPGYEVAETGGVEAKEVTLRIIVEETEEDGRICPACAERILSSMLQKLLQNMRADHNPPKAEEEAKQV